MVAISAMVWATPHTTLCGSTSHFTIVQRSNVSHMKALMQHYQTARFSDEVSRLEAAPRRVSLNKLHVRRQAASLCSLGLRIDPIGPTAAQIATFLFSLYETHGLAPQTVKGHRSCLASVLCRTDRATVVKDRIISNMISCKELARPTIMPVLPVWDLGIVLENLNKPPYEPLGKHLTYKRVLLLASSSELQALVFDLKYKQFKPKGVDFTL